MKYIIIFFLLIPSLMLEARLPGRRKLPYERDPAWGHAYAGIKFGIENYSYGRYPNAMYFQFNPPTPGFIVQQNIIVPDISRLYHVTLGGEWSMKKRLYTSLNASFNPSINSHVIWNVSGGLGYVCSLTKDERVLLRPRVDAAISYYRYKIGSDYTDESQQGIILNDKNIGSHLDKIIYVNRDIAVIPGIDLVYQFEHVNFFAGLACYIPVSGKESIHFKTDRKTYKARLDQSDFIRDYEGYTVRENMIENIRFVQVRAGMTVRIGDSYYNISKKVAEY